MRQIQFDWNETGAIREEALTDPRKIRIELPHAQYDILVGNQLSEIGSVARNWVRATKAFVISDQNVADLYLKTVEDSLESADVKLHSIVVAPGEKSKSLKVAEEIWEEMCEQGADRKSCIFALGGGVVGDLAGFIAATYARGLSFVQIPTSLLAQVDSSVGGKVGINLSLAKNMVGCFWQPQGVLIDLHVLRTLSAREYRSGLAEVVKYGVILDEQFFAYLEDHYEQINQQDLEVLSHIVARSCELKAEVVRQDEKELTGLRAVLNYGHTYAHAFESLAGYGTIAHGEAVAMGMVCASRLAEKIGMIDPQVTQRQIELLNNLQIPIEPPKIEFEGFSETILRDKKAEGGKARFILPTKIGHVELVDNIPPKVAYDVMYS